MADETTGGARAGGEVRLRELRPEDLPIFFDHESDPAAYRMAAFTAKNPEDRDAFMARWERISNDESIVKRTVLWGDRVAGHVLSFEYLGIRHVSYWIGREFWGKGIATTALGQFLHEIETRPLFARVAKDNIASIRVLEKCGFTVTGEDKAFSDVRNEEVEEFVLVLSPGRRHPGLTVVPAGIERS